MTVTFAQQQIGKQSLFVLFVEFWVFQSETNCLIGGQMKQDSLRSRPHRTQKQICVKTRFVCVLCEHSNMLGNGIYVFSAFCMKFCDLGLSARKDNFLGVCTALTTHTSAHGNHPRMTRTRGKRESFGQKAAQKMWVKTASFNMSSQ